MELGQLSDSLGPDSLQLYRDSLCSLILSSETCAVIVYVYVELFRDLCEYTSSILLLICRSVILQISKIEGELCIKRT